MRKAMDTMTLLQQVLQHLHAGRWNAAHDLVQ
ncbi:hypothetical protein J2X15_002688 [Rhodoferax saidenbachensis]|uniref:Uncharacterized protein n=1 Tax=Rhodoferax saidenbachensis TaxID=1484693 RepID=A0ABU1ZPC9_9BURK|nr:hypothetical protein [Rhodoferax saidenbachensis]